MESVKELRCETIWAPWSNIAELMGTGLINLERLYFQIIRLHHIWNFAVSAPKSREIRIWRIFDASDANDLKPNIEIFVALNEERLKMNGAENFQFILMKAYFCK